MVRQVPAQFFEVVPRSSDRRSRPARIAQFASPFVFTTLQIPFSATPLLSHPYETLEGASVHACSRRFVAASQCPRLTQLGQCSKSYLFSRLPPLELSCLSFSASRLLESVAYSLFPQNTGGGVGCLLPQYARIPKGQTSFRLHEVSSTSQAGSQEVRAVCSSAQRRRRLHIQLSLLQAQGSQVHG